MAPGSSLSLSLSPPPPPLIPPFPGGGGEEKEKESPPFPEDSRPLNQTAPPPLCAEGRGGKKEPLLIMWGSHLFLCAMLHFACSAGWKMGGWGGGTDRPQPLPVAKIMSYYSAAEGKGCLSSSCKHSVPVIHFLSGGYLL